MTDDAHDTSDHRKKWPTPGPNEPIPSWPEYNQVKEAVDAYLDHEPDDPKWNDIWRALAAIMGDYQRNQFVEAFDLDEPAETACIRRLITGDDECPHSPLEAHDDPTGPAHKPTASDHATLWLDDGEPAVYSMHVYPGNIERLDAAVQPVVRSLRVCRRVGPRSQHPREVLVHLGNTVQLVFYPPERCR